MGSARTRALLQRGKHARRVFGFLVGHGRQLGQVSPPLRVACVGCQRFLRHDRGLAVRQLIKGKGDRQGRRNVQVVPEGIDGQFRRPGVDEDEAPRIVRQITARNDP